MNSNGYIIRLEQERDHRETERLVRQAFWNIYREGCVEHYLLHILRTKEAFYPDLNFVMEKDGRRIGQTVFFKAQFRLDEGNTLSAAVNTHGIKTYAITVCPRGGRFFFLQEIKSRIFRENIVRQARIS